MNKVINSVLVASSLALIGGACYKAADTNVNVAGNANAVESNTNTSINTNTEINGNLVVNANVNTNSTAIDTSTWLVYSNEDYGFSFSYPENWKISKDIFAEYKKSYDNPRYKVNEKDIVFITSLSDTEIASEIEEYRNLTEETGSGVIESIGEGHLISVAVSNQEVSDLVSETGFTFTIGDELTLDKGIVATNVYLRKTWEGNSDYHYIYIPFQSDALTNMGKEIKSLVFTIETNDGNYNKDEFLEMAKSFQKNS